MNPFTIEELAAARRADLRRSAMASCCAALSRRVALRDRMARAVDAARSRIFGFRPASTPSCCPA